MSRYNVKMLIADGFYSDESATQIKYTIMNLPWVEKQYGEELENFNLIQPNMEPMFSDVLGESVTIDEDRSGIFRKTMHTIHFEEFDGLNEWCFVVALEKCTFNIYKHLGSGSGEVGIVDAVTALDGWKFNYRNFFEWNVETNIVLEPGQGVFFRPWVFHSFQGGLVQYYRLLTDKHSNIRKKVVLIMGLPGSGKTTLTKQLVEKTKGSHINADEVRTMYNDFDFSIDGRQRQSIRMRKLCNLSVSEYTFADFVCPTQITRDLFDADFIVWMNTIDKSKYEDTNQVFENPIDADLIISDFNYSIDDILSRINIV